MHRRLSTKLWLSGLTATALLATPTVAGALPAAGAATTLTPQRPHAAQAVAAAATPRTADWMGRVFDRARGTVLADMLVPGTHDSGAYAIDVTPPCRIETVAGAKPYFVTFAEQNPCTAGALAKAQDLSLREQLEAGVRYLDLRVGVPASKVISAPRPPAPNPAAVPLVLQHNYASVRVTTALREIQRFTARHPREQVILDFQHIDLTGTPGIDRYYVNALDRLLHKYRPGGVASVCQTAWTDAAIPVSDRRVGTAVSIGRAWRADRSLLVLMPDTMPEVGCYRDRGAVIVSPWPNSDDPAVSRAANEEYLAERTQRLRKGGSACQAASAGNEDGNWCGLFVNQLQLTPSTQRYLDCIQGTGTDCSLQALAGLVNDSVAGLMTRWTDRGKPTNISIVDYVEQSDPQIIARLIRLNRDRVAIPVVPARG